jgi:hypothetical protein
VPKQTTLPRTPMIETKERKRMLPNLKYYPGICLALGKTMINSIGIAFVLADTEGHAIAFETLCNKPEGRGLGHWIFQLT